ncbi:fumarate reductase subunit C [Rhodocyclus tenuis]|uniref:Fumarate reductase subunit C n=1 Tax=Rhodocyclus tenuis TaxID=1066 RepID=A0A840GCZ6_RHOTE|nr:fumarate reductase subunit C [Rhodocyclus tenuis]MBB4248740.1 fumarate reductase subunit C [Rhodocyclus tenuis]
MSASDPRPAAPRAAPALPGVAGNPRRPYVRPMAGWWLRNPYFVRYMAREGTAVFVAAYALILLVGLVRLAQGEAAWNGWLEALRSPLSTILHLVFLAVFVFHTVTWFEVLPKTMPPLLVGGKRVAQSAITAGAIAVAAAASLALFGIVWGLTR